MQRHGSGSKGGSTCLGGGGRGRSQALQCTWGSRAGWEQRWVLGAAAVHRAAATAWPVAAACIQTCLYEESVSAPFGMPASALEVCSSLPGQEYPAPHPVRVAGRWSCHLPPPPPQDRHVKVDIRAMLGGPLPAIAAEFVFHACKRPTFFKPYVGDHRIW
eukprot:1149358-Pelagomonas_calceolata.AAC.2